MHGRRMAARGRFRIEPRIAAVFGIDDDPVGAAGPSAEHAADAARGFDDEKVAPRTRPGEVFDP